MLFSQIPALIDHNLLSSKTSCTAPQFVDQIIQVNELPEGAAYYVPHPSTYQIDENSDYRPADLVIFRRSLVSRA